MIAALLLNYKRPENLNKIIQVLRQQTIPIEIWLWNNNKEDKTRYDVDQQIDSTINLMCSPRWIMAGYLSNQIEYVFSLDDDLLPLKNNTLETCYNFAKEFDCSLGYSGVVLNSQKDYWKSPHIMKPFYKGDCRVDIIKGRFIFCKKDIVTKINWLTLPKAKNYRIEDDIILSASMSNKIIPARLSEHFQELPQPHALMQRPDHRISRTTTCLEYFK